MIHFLEQNIAYIHVPRTGGTAFEDALADHSGAVRYWSTIAEHHMTAHAAAVRFPGCLTFAVIRNPWDFFCSFYGLCWMCATEEERPRFPDGHAAEMTTARDGMAELAQLDFPDFVRRMVDTDWMCVGKASGLWQMYCQLDTLVFVYSADVNERIARWLRLDVTIPRCNGFAPRKPVAWTPSTIRLVGDYCRGDVERFGFLPPQR